MMLSSCSAQPAYASDGVVCVPARAANGKIKRSEYQVRLFRKANPCPATGLVTGSCKGYVVDHIKPLCACGADIPANMQWQNKATSLVKDDLERAICHVK